MVRSLPEELPKHHRKVTIANMTEPTCSHHNRCRSSDAIDETRPALRDQATRVLVGREPFHLVLPR
jgi:hypothetical protein